MQEQHEWVVVVDRREPGSSDEDDMSIYGPYTLAAAREEHEALEASEGISSITIARLATREQRERESRFPSAS